MKTIILALLIVGCGGGDSPTPTETVCPSPDPQTVTYDNFGQTFMADYCTQCHASTLPRAQRNGAPLFRDFDDLIGIVQDANHIDEQIGRAHV